MGMNYGNFGKQSRRPSKLQQELLDRAAQVREKLGPKPPEYICNNHALFFPSSYKMTLLEGQQEQEQERGFCNWLIPGHLMVGQYPGQTPEVNGPSEEEVLRHLDLACCNNNIRLFCSLQSELPAQDDWETWNRHNGMIFLQPESVRRQFPRPFTHYAPLVQQILTNNKNNPALNVPLSFIHTPIEDLNIPESQEPLQELLLRLLDFINDNHSANAAIYLHCWGGRGRAGLVGACLLSLIWPTLDATTILDWVQTGYASRLGHHRIPLALSQSPQTSTQRAFVRTFVQDYQTLLRYTTT